MSEPRGQGRGRRGWLTAGAVLMLAAGCSGESRRNLCAPPVQGVGGAIEKRKIAAEVKRREARCGACPIGQACNIALPDSVCRPTPGQVGEVCADGEYTFPCAEGLACPGKGRPEGQRCTRKIAPGAACDHTVPCEGKAVCRRASVDVPMTGPFACLPRGRVGDACGARLDCDDGLDCGDGRCKER